MTISTINSRKKLKDIIFARCKNEKQNLKSKYTAQGLHEI